MTLTVIADNLKSNQKKVILVYAFNATGKTRLSVAYKDATKVNGKHSGVYYNAFSEDLFVWNNDDENRGANIHLKVMQSSLSQFHALLNEDKISEKMRAYKPKFEFKFKMHKNTENGIESISFYIPNPDLDAPRTFIKISRGEERIFVWCFFLALFEVEGWADKQSSHFFIDDPVSSLDDHNIFVTASTIYELIKTHFERRKIIVTTHHIGLFYLLKDWLSDISDKKIQACILQNDGAAISLRNDGQEVMLYHLRLLQILMKARQTNDLRAFHLVLLRQLLENISSFLGKPNFSYALDRIGIQNPNDVADMVNALSHKKIFHYESDRIQDASKEMAENILDRIQSTYHFDLKLAET